MGPLLLALLLLLLALLLLLLLLPVVSLRWCASRPAGNTRKEHRYISERTAGGDTITLSAAPPRQQAVAGCCKLSSINV